MTAEFNFYEFKHNGRLPSPKGVALRIMQLVQQDEVSVMELAQVVKTDPALTSRILSLTNSAAFGAHRQIANINEAVQLLGIHAVRNLALSLSLVGNNLKGPCRDFDYNAYWMQSLVFAVSIAVLSARQPTIAPEEAFTLGLLSEVGQLALATAWPENFSHCLKIAQGEDLLKLEADCFAIDHRILTLMLMQDWGLPAIFLDALKLSYGVPLAEVTRTTRLSGQLTFTRHLTAYCVADEQNRVETLPELEQIALAHDLDSQALQTLIAEIIKQWHVWGALIDIKTDRQSFFQMPPVKVTEGEPLQGAKIILLTNGSAVFAQLSQELKAVGHQVVHCRDAESTLKQVLEQSFQVLIVEWCEKPYSALTLCKTLRSTEMGKKLYIILLTSPKSEDELVSAFDSGIDDYVTEPVNVKILLARIRSGQRVTALHREIEQEKDDIQRYNAELALSNRRLNVMANTDALTGLSNRRYALQRLKQELEAAVRYNRPLSVLMLDLDYFKIINDSLGHEAGDDVLMHTANLMQAAARATDVVCRFGGEEFLIIATNTDANTALLQAERIRSSIQKFQPNDIALAKPITVSIGVAGSVGQKTDSNELIRQADQALYLAKASGRNKSCLAEG